MKNRTIPFFSTHQFEFGGSLLKGNHPKEARPFSKSKIIHIIFRSREKRWLQPQRRKLLSILLKKYSKQIKLKQISIQSDHFHLFVRAKNKTHFQSFMRSFPGLISRLILNTEKGRPRPKDKDSFWLFRPYTRLIGTQKNYQLEDDTLLGWHLALIQVIPDYRYFNTA